ncbi:MAG: tetratricopeptide repeat protein [Persicimonas sp.]
MHLKHLVSSVLLTVVVCVGVAPEAAAQEGDAQSGQASGQASGDEGTDDQADADGRYESLTKQAAKAYRSKDYDGALELFEQAYATKQVPNLLYNMGRIHEKRGNFDAAIEYYEKFVTKPGVNIKARRDALGRLKTLREVVALRQEGEDVDEEEIQEKHKDRELVDAMESEPQPERAPEVTANYVPAWITLGAAAAAYGTSGYFALRARDANADFESANNREDRREASSRGETASIVADSTLAAGVLLTGVSVYFFLSPPTDEAPADGTAMHLSPQFGTDGAGVSLNMSF